MNQIGKDSKDLSDCLLKMELNGGSLDESTPEGTDYYPGGTQQFIFLKPQANGYMTAAPQSNEYASNHDGGKGRSSRRHNAGKMSGNRVETLGS